MRWVELLEKTPSFWDGGLESVGLPEKEWEKLRGVLVTGFDLGPVF